MHLAGIFASSLMWRGKHTPPRTWFQRLSRVPFLALLSGRTLEPSTLNPSGGVLTSLLAATHASHSRSPGRAAGRMTPGTSGPASAGSSENAPPAGASSRTCEGMCRSGCATCDATWKTWATGLRLDYSRRRKSAPRTDGSESISWPTPTVCGNDNRTGASPTSGDGLATADRRWPTPTAKLGDPRRGFPSPALGQARLDSGRSNLDDAVAARSTWPTPTARDWKSGSASPETMARNSRPLSEAAGPGQLNPTWVEWLMGCPTGWTDCASLGTESSPNAPNMLSVHSMDVL